MAVDAFWASPDGRRLEAWVANNDVAVTGPPGMRYGIRLIASEGARLVNNRVAGDGRGGVLVDNAHDCRIQSTDFQAFTPQGPAGSPVGHLLLGPNSSDCVAVTVPASATVVDAGTNNVVRRTAR
jgi:hypothetical protein